MFVPQAFEVPRRLEGDGLLLVPLGPEHSEADLAAWTSDVEHVRSTPGFAGRDWPPAGGMPLEQNTDDLVRHAADFEARRGFTYTVLRPSDGLVIGCLYIYPDPEGDGEGDAVVRMWVRGADAELDAPLYGLVRTWIDTVWPFRSPSFPGR